MKKIIILTTIAFLLNACVTQKKRNDVSKTKKMYHDVTAEFNGYFNATELYKFSVLSLSEQNPENYNKLLPIYPYVASENPAAVAADMDEAIKKVTVVAALHNPSHWVDDCYLLAGKAQYLKQDYESAEETLEFLVAEFSPEALLDKKNKKTKPKSKKERVKVAKEKDKERKDTRKEKEQTAKQKRKAYEKARKQKNKEIAARRKAKKKGKAVAKKPEEVIVETKVEVEAPKVEESEGTEDSKEDNLDEPTGPFKHKPIHQEGQLWLARTYIERDKPDQAAYLIRELKNKDKLYPNVARELPVVLAHFAFIEKKYNEAIEPLKQAIELSENKQDRARYTYILAQLEEMNGNNNAAYARYEEVVKMNPKYEMDFSARMSMLLNRYRSGSAGKEETAKALEKLTKDEKNIDYLDRIYFAIAEIYLETGDEDNGVKYLELALAQGTSNPAQQAESFLKLAKIYYEKQNYVKASEYYNQALPNISKNDERYPAIAELSGTLKEIAAQITKISLQDSLVRVGKMTPDEKRALAFDIKKKQDEERRQLAISAAQEEQNRPQRRSPRAIPGATQVANKSTFWAYDDRSVKRGKRDFDRQWGERPLSDNWRRQSAQGSAEFEEGTDEELDLANSGLLTDDQVANILRGVPQSKQQLAQAEGDKYNAMFKLGVLYRERLKKIDKAIETLEKMLREYPATENKAEAYYHLYLAHKDLLNGVNAQRYLDRLIEEFPESPFTKVLTDPNYALKVDADKRALNDFYDATYQLFSEGKYQEVNNRLQQVDTKFGADNVLKARFALLNAMTAGNLQGKDAYVKELRDVIKKHPKTDEQKRAREILRLLGVSSGNPIPGGGSTEGTAEFKYEPEKLHYMVIVLDPKIALTDAKVKIAEFNRKYHKSDNLRVSNIYLTPAGQERIPLIVLRRFKNAEAAMKYYKNVELNATDFVNDSDYMIYPVTQESYRVIMKNKSVAGYDSFFEENYE